MALDRNGLLSLGLMSLVGLFLAIDWLFLTGAILALILYFTSRGTQGAAPGFAEVLAPPAPPQQPIVIQSVSSSIAHDFYREMTQSILQQSMQSDQFSNLSHDIQGLQGSISGKVGKLEKQLGKLEKSVESIPGASAGDSHGGHH